MFGFGKKEPKKTPKEHAREVRREMGRGKRDMSREIRDLERQEARCTAEIKKAAKANNKAGLKTLAKQLHQTRQQKVKLQGMSSTLDAVGTRATVMASTATMAGAMKSATDAMAATNAELKKSNVTGTMREFMMQSEAMGLTEETMGDAMDDLFEGDSEEEDEIVAGVLGELAIDLSGQMAHAPTTGVGVAPARGVATGDAEADALLREVLG